MPQNTSGSVKPSELFRERLVIRYYNALPKLPEYSAVSSSPSGFVARSSPDNALTAFAQLAALRLDATHAFISLIDSQNQYVLAEATKSLSMQSDSRHDRNDSLWLGGVIIPREKGLCQVVLAKNVGTQDADADPIDIVILHDPRDDPRFSNLIDIPASGDLRFYAGVPIKTANGTKIGSFCVVDNKSRADLSIEGKTFLRDMAKTTINHLDAARLRVEHLRKHQIMKGIESFIDGFADLKAVSADEKSRDLPDTPDDIRQGRVNFATETALADARKECTSTSQAGTGVSQVSTSSPSPSLWESALPPGTKTMFSRAATIIRQSGEYDGVGFFYMSSASTRTNATPRHGPAVHSTQPRESGLSDVNTASSTHLSSGDSDSDDTTQDETVHIQELDDTTSMKSACPVLSFSLGIERNDAQEITQGLFPNFKQRDMIRLLGKRPRGRTFTLNRYGSVYTGDTFSGSGPGNSSGFPASKYYSSGTQGTEGTESSAQMIRKSLLRSLHKVGPSGRSFVCLPLWDFERQRWFAYAICWSNSASRDPGLDGDLHLLRIFGNSVMNALSHLDAIAANRAKTAFVSSISHELRSPLHGILGASNFLLDSSLDHFQQEMVESIAVSGRTLLETIDHIMDFAKINSFTDQAQPTSPSKRFSKSQRREGKLSKSSLSAPMNLASLLEEVLDIVLMGYYVQHDFIYPDESNKPGSARLPTFNTNLQKLASSGRAVNQRGRVRIALQMPYLENWCIHSQPGAWRRIIMNLFGNALKYTADGLILIRLQPKAIDDSDNKLITLSIVDTGKGISNDYLENRLFLPFSQDDSFASGTGLGLSIVDQIVRSMDGALDITSSTGVGTSVRIDLPLKAADRVEPLTRNLETVGSIPDRVRGMKVCILEQSLTEIMRDTKKLSAEREFLISLLGTVKDWFGIETTIETSWTPATADMIILVRPSFALLDMIRGTAQGTSVPPVIIIAFDALEMSVLQADVRISDGSSIVEVMSQPVGPRKLAVVFAKCLERSQDLAQSQQEKGDTIAQSSRTPIEPSFPARSAVRKPPHSPPRRQLEDLSIATSSGPTVLIVDDNRLNIRLLEAFTKKLKIDTYKAMNGQEAVDLYKQLNGSLQAVLMDISMPIMDGMTATRQIRDFEKEFNMSRIPIVALTGLASTAARLEAQEAGMDVFLTKPVSFKILRELLPKVFGLGLDIAAQSPQNPRSSDFCGYTFDPMG